MKKSLIALAALGAFAGAVSAQSSVTMFGVVDLNLLSVDNDQRTYSMGASGMSSSRLGFRGVEDLGGGLKAGFWLEMGLAPDTGRNGEQWGNGAAGTGNELIFNRRSTLSLSNQWGELRLGRDYVATFWNWTVFDPFGTNGVGAATNLVLPGELVAAGAATGSSFGTLVRANNMVAYILPSGQFGPGLYGQVQMAAGEGATGNKYWGGRIGYAAGPFDVAASYGYSDCIDLACSIDLTQWNIGGSWNFGFMKLSGFYGDISGDGPGGSAGRDNWFVGASAPFGQWNFKASYGGTNGNDQLSSRNATQWALGADYNLSKRTALYGTWSTINNDGTRFVTSSQSNTPVGSFNSNGVQVGVRHSF